MTNDGSVRNLEQIQETDEATRVPRGVTLVLVVLGTAAIGIAALTLTGHSSKETPKRVDPLGDLVAQKSHQGPGRPADLSAHEVTFPQILSDDDKPTTALAAVRPGANVTPDPTVTAMAPPPVASDRLPVMPVPAQDVLQASPVVTRPRDNLTKAAADTAQIADPPAATAPAGHDGGYQLQVSSFRSQAEANQFSDQLRARGHKSYVLEAHVNGRGTWYRVRVGPFKTQHEAAGYRSTFEAREHVVPFIVQPVGK
jgi:DedD protein